MFTTIKKYFFFFIALFSLNSLIAQPMIISFSPESGKIGDTILITGTNFNATLSNNIVYFGSVKVTVIEGTTTLLKVIVPTGVTYQPITVTTNGLTAYSVKPFVVVFGGAIAPNSFAMKTDFTAGNYPAGISFGDLNEDGKSELITTNYSSNDIFVYRNISAAGNVSFESGVSYATAAKPEGISLGDLNGDGKLDIVVTSIDDHLFSVFINTSNGANISFASRQDFATGATRWPRGVAITDLDADGKPDIITPDNNLTLAGGNPNPFGTVTIYKNTSSVGNLSFASPEILNADDYPRKVFTADLDGDGKPDIVVGNNNTASITVFKNNSVPGTVSFSGGTDYTTGGNPEEISMGDLDGDNKADVAVANFTGSTVSVFRNTSSGATISFAPKQDLVVATPIGISMGDLDGDGKPDLAVASYNSSTVAVFRNTSTGSVISFAPKIHYPAGNGIVDVYIGDADGDGIPDLSTTNSTDNKTSVLRIMNDPALSYFSPTFAGAGTTVTIKGINFTGTSAVSFGGTPATSFMVESLTTIKAVVGTGATGNISVTTPFGSRTLGGFTFNVVTGIYEPSAFVSEFYIFPSLVKDFCTIRYKRQYLPKPFYCQLVDMTGKVLNMWNLTKTIETLDLHKIPAGVYFIKFSEQDTWKSFTKKIIKL
jgi:hypothetical protein